MWRIDACAFDVGAQELGRNPFNSTRPMNRRVRVRHAAQSDEYRWFTASIRLLRIARAMGLPEGLVSRQVRWPGIVMFATTMNSKFRSSPQIRRLVDCTYSLHTTVFVALHKTIFGGPIMKSLIKAVAIAALLAAPVVSFAQTNEPVTRAQVRNELIQLEKAGYNPSISNDEDYPADIQAAEARVAAEKATAQADTTGYGASANGSTQAGQRTETVVSPYSPPVYNVR
jgi:hypothetical protein